MFSLATNAAAIDLYLQQTSYYLEAICDLGSFFFPFTQQKKAITRAKNGFRSDHAAWMCVNVCNGVDKQIIESHSHTAS